MNSIKKLMAALDASKTAYHAVAFAVNELEANGFAKLEEGNAWSLSAGGKYYVIRDGSALIAFSIGTTERGGFHIVASHVDSPCLKIKGEAITTTAGCTKLSVEPYGGSLLYSWLDRPLCLAGRTVSYDRATGSISAQVVSDTHSVVIPSLAIHLNREANKNLALNPQVDLQPILSLNDHFKLYFEADGEKEILERDLFLVNAAKPCLCGFAEEFLVSPRLDNLTSAFASIEAICQADVTDTAVIYLADHEEVGSRSKQGAASDFLYSVLSRVAVILGRPLEELLPRSFMVTCDNAHAIHPNHPEKSDPLHPVTMGGGVVIKHHAGQNYTTDAMSAAIFKAILQKANVPYQDFYMRADMPCGSTLGAVSSAQVSVRSIDIGIGQLAMHAATETMCASDYICLLQALQAFFAASLDVRSYAELTLQ